MAAGEAAAHATAATAGAAERPGLSIRNLGVTFGGIVALDDVSFDVHAGELVGLIGPNGAGKTTVFNCVTRMQRPDRGSIQFGGLDLLRAPRGGAATTIAGAALRATGALSAWPRVAAAVRAAIERGTRRPVPPHAVIGLGIARTYQTPALFPGLNVLENLLLGQEARLRYGLAEAALRLPRVSAQERRARERCLRALAFCGLEPFAESLPGDLPLAVQRRVELARALASEPALLLLDEPAGGLTHEELLELEALIGRARAELGVGVLLVEHHMGLVMRLCDRVVVLNFGKRIAEGHPDEIRAAPSVIEAYLGRQA